MPSGLEIKDKFICDYSSDLYSLFNIIKEKGLIKNEDKGNQMVDFIDFIIYNIDIHSFLKK